MRIGRRRPSESLQPQYTIHCRVYIAIITPVYNASILRGCESWLLKMLGADSLVASIHCLWLLLAVLNIALRIKAFGRSSIEHGQQSLLLGLDNVLSSRTRAIKDTRQLTELCVSLSLLQCNTLPNAMNSRGGIAS